VRTPDVEWRDLGTGDEVYVSFASFLFRQPTRGADKSGHRRHFPGRAAGAMSAAVGLMAVLPVDDAADLAWDALVTKARTLVQRLGGGARAPSDVGRSFVGGVGPEADGNGNGCGDGDDERTSCESHPFQALIDALAQITQHANEDEEFVAALGETNGHDVLMRLVLHPDENVAETAADALQVCADANPPGSPFPNRTRFQFGSGGSRPSRTVLHVGKRGDPLGTCCAFPKSRTTVCTRQTDTFFYASQDLNLRRVRENLGGEKKSIPNIAWHAGVVLSRWVARRPEIVCGKDVLEIGAGLGSPGFTAAAFGAKSVLVTDVCGTAVRNLRYNAGRGGAASSASRNEDFDACNTKEFHESKDTKGTTSTSLHEKRRRIRTRCVAATLDWNEEEDGLLVGLRARVQQELGRGGGHKTSHTRPGDASKKTDADEHEETDGSEPGKESNRHRNLRKFNLLLGADVIHEEGMAQGVVRCLTELLWYVLYFPNPDTLFAHTKLTFLLVISVTRTDSRLF
jgi:hypothetical protein